MDIGNIVWGMERQTPAIISKAIEAQRAKVAREAEERRVSHEAPVVRNRLRTLIQAIVPNPQLDEENIYLNEGVRVRLEYPVAGETTTVVIETSAYPRDIDDIPHYYDITVGEGEDMQRRTVLIDKLQKHEGSTSVPFVESDLNELNDLLSGIEDGIKDNSIYPIIERPRPYAKAGHLIEKLADEAAHTG
jgi:hypothetical protein